MNQATERAYRVRTCPSRGQGVEKHVCESRGRETKIWKVYTIGVGFEASEPTRCTSANDMHGTQSE